MPASRVNGIDVYYERSGAGPPLLFLNGSGATLETAGLLIKPFTERCDVLAFDQRGLGRTSIPPGPYTMADYARDAAALLDEIGWKSCRVVGVSFGGMVAQELAVTCPDRVDKLALCCTSPGGPDLASFPLHELSTLPPAERAQRGIQLLDTRFNAEYLAAHPADKGLAELLASRHTAGKSPEQQRGEAEQLHARARHDVRERLGRINAPTMVACGRYDGIAPLANSEFIAAHIPHAELHEYEGGHAFFAQDPKALPEIMEFLAT
jgi:pimeloyl-ACP methyl ester carboxylesterase